MHRFLALYHQYVKPTDTLIIAVSGGVDSMVLLDIIQKNHSKDSIVVAHFDHSLRGDESDGDRLLVTDTCKREKITIEVKKMDIGKIAKDEKKSIEAIAREKRYEFLQDIRTKYDASYILTAHHMDDQAETILMNLIKGGKVRGLSGMQIISGYILRPLLNISKSDLLDYAHSHNIHYREDRTNQDTHYERNHIRHNIIPLLGAINPSIDETFTDLGLYMQELAVFLGGYVDNWLGDAEKLSGKERSFLIPGFVSLDQFMQREIISVLYARAQGGSTQGLTRGAIDECIRFISEAKNSHGIKEIKNLILDRRGERVYISNKNNHSDAGV